jgi:glucosylceramidase
MKNKMNLLVLLLVSLFWNCGSDDATEEPTNQPPAVIVTNDVDFWLTKGDKSVLLQKQTGVLGFNANFNSFPSITVDETQTFQTMDGFGYTLTGGSAQVINQLNPTKKAALLQELFGNSATSISVSYLRLSIGASDLNATAFTYNDGAVDTSLSSFSLAQDQNTVIDLLKEILLINPNIKIVATPWSAPAWMKTNNSLIGGSLQTQYYGVYANYFVKYLQQMKLQGITIDAITPQNEPENPNNNPSMLMTAVEQINFIKNNLGPALQAANLNTKIITFDHNCDNNGQYPIAILNDPAAANFVDGSAFHLYAGDISTLSVVRNVNPNKNIYFTEQFTSSTGNFGADLQWHLRNVIVGASRNWSKNALEWNLANDSSIGPHTSGGCTTCLGALTISDSENFTRNVGYYIIGHASKFVPLGSVRIGSNTLPNLNNVAFKTPTGKKVLVVANDGTSLQTFKISFNNKWVTVSLDSGSVGTFIW